jgi:pyrimidine-nucleoside phosphorylase
MTDIIMQKRDGKKLSEREIRFFIEDFTGGEIPDYQASAFLMAAFLRGMDDEETTALTLAMADSGDKADFSGIHGTIADKHSTGGVADTTTLVAAPIAAACGVKLAKMSGRGLGHTGGTIDKLESIPGFDTALSMQCFISQVNEVGLAVMGQTLAMCPADKKLYALRDVTATVESIPLIASSIMSKKIASGAPVIVLDVKTGSGAFMKKYEDSLELAKKMVSIGHMAGRRVHALITDMNEPLGQAIGNALEVKEAVQILKGECQGDLKELSVLLAAELVYASSIAQSSDDAKTMAETALKNGEALHKFKAMVVAQKGNTAFIDNPDSIIHASIRHDILFDAEGYFTAIDTYRLGVAAAELGAGRKTKDDAIDPSVGIWMHKRIGDHIKKGDRLCTLYANDESKLNTALEALQGSIRISQTSCEMPKLVYARVTADGVEEY